jgi:methyl-accepting chemotaxis protein
VRLPRLTIKLRLIMFVVLITGLSLSLVAVYITRHNMTEARRTGLAFAQESAARNAAEVQERLVAGIRTARDLARALPALAASGSARRLANAEMRSVLEGHEDYLGVWTAWEPNAFDGKDRRYRNADARTMRPDGSSPTGTATATPSRRPC